MKRPELEKRLAAIGKINLCVGETPIHDMPSIARQLGVRHAYIKRDDLTGLGPGGNKVRNREYILYRAIRLGADTVIVSGPAQSNLCSIAACARARLGMGCVLVQNGPEDPGSAGNLLLSRLAGADMRYLGNVDWTVRNAHMQTVKDELEAEGRKPFVIENGASTGYGALGYVDAVCEIARQNDVMGGVIRTLFVPAGNGGVAAGVTYGNYLLDFPFRVVVVSSEHDRDRLPAEMTKVIREAEELIGVPFEGKVEDACLITDEYYGGGWSLNTPESEAAVYRLARNEGIFLENVYTSKTFVGFCDMIEKGLVEKEGNLFLHSGGFGSLFAQYPDE